MFAAENRKRCDRKATLNFLNRSIMRYGGPKEIVTDRLHSYGAAMKVIGNLDCQECGRWLNNRAKYSHQPIRRREGALTRFRKIKTLQNFTSDHAPIHNHFNHDRHLCSRDIFTQNALQLWQSGVNRLPDKTGIWYFGDGFALD